MQYSLDSSRTRRRNFVRKMRRRGTVHLRRFPVLQQAPVRLVPLRELGRFLHPVRDRGLVAPLKQLGHNAAMRARGAICLHRGVFPPHRQRPEDVPGFAHNRAADEALDAALAGEDPKAAAA